MNILNIVFAIYVTKMQWVGITNTVYIIAYYNYYILFILLIDAKKGEKEINKKQDEGMQNLQILSVKLYFILTNTLIIDIVNLKVIKLNKNGFRTNQGIEIQVSKSQQTINDILHIIKEKVGSKWIDVNFETLYYIDGAAAKAPHLAIIDIETLEAFILRVSKTRKNLSLCLELLPEKGYLSCYIYNYL